MTGNELKALIGSSPNEWHKKFYNEYKNYVYTIVFNRLRHIAYPEDIEECVSDVFADIFLDTYRFLGMDELSGIVGLIAKRKAILYYRRLSTERGIYDKLEDIADDSDMETDSEERELALTVLDRIKALGQPDSAIILMSYYYGMTSSQIGKKLDITAFTVRKRKGRALKKLKELLIEKGIDEKEW